MWTINPAEGSDKTSTILEAKGKLESLKGKIDGLISLQVGLNKNETPEAYDLCLITEHPTWKDLQFYQDHPLHKEVAGFIGKIRKTRAVVDFEF
jgi:hypothetical protein